MMIKDDNEGDNDAAAVDWVMVNSRCFVTCCYVSLRIVNERSP